MEREVMNKNIINRSIKKRNAISAALAVCAALGWWGAIYPQFTLLRGTYEIVCEEEGQRGDEAVQSGESVIESEPDGAELYWEILEADCSRIRFKSRLFKEWNALQEQRREVHESGSQQ